MFVYSRSQVEAKFGFYLASRVDEHKIYGKRIPKRSYYFIYILPK
jgi:hypothetical protein